MAEIVRTEKAPAAIGPYSQAVKVAGGTFLFCSGQIPIDPQSGEVVGETAAAQCRQVMQNLAAVLEAAGADFSSVVKTTIYLADLGDFGPVNDVYSTYFRADPPARMTVEVSRLPKDVKVAVEAIASL